jgi:hypothetical protein
MVWLWGWYGSGVGMALGGYGSGVGMALEVRYMAIPAGTGRGEGW